MSGLIDLFPPEQDEGPVGYFRRLAMRNGYAGWRGLVRSAGANPTLNALWKNREQLMLSLSIEASWFASVLPKAQQDSLHDPFFIRTKSEPVCPECLSKYEYLRHAWSHCLVVACPVHRCRLIDQCPSCNSPLENSRNGIALCDCGYDLRYGKAPVASPIECWVSARLAGDMRLVDGTNEIGKADDYRLLPKLLFQLTVRYDPTLKIRPGKVARPKTVTESIAFLRPVLSMLEGFRPRFAAHIADRFSKGPPDAFSLSGRLGAWYMSLDALCRKKAAFPLVWEIFSDAVFDNFEGVCADKAD